MKTGLVSETSEAVVLKMAERKQQTIGWAEIDRIKVSDKSLMPEGIEKDATPQQMEDLLEFLKGRDYSDSRNAVTAANCIGDEECFQIRTPARRIDDASKEPLFC